MTKRILSIVLSLVLLLSMTATPAFAASGKTVTFNGGYIYQNEKGKPGTIQMELTNIAKTETSVKINEKDLMDYVDDETVADAVIYYNENDEAVTVKDIVTSDDGVTVYYADKAPVTVTAKFALSCFWVTYTGNVVKATYAPQYYSFNDYLYNSDNLKVYDEQPDGNYLLAPGTIMQLNKPGRYLFVVKDDGLIDGSPANAFCVIVSGTATDKQVTALTLNNKSVTLTKGKTYTLIPTIAPKDATNKKVTWTSSNKKVATVDMNGKVKAVGKGTATIACKAADGSGKNVTCKITVK